MKILLTGGAGFIGSYVARAYLQSGFEVVVVDNLSSGTSEAVPKGAKFYQADINNYWEMEEIFMLEKPDVVNHHAGQISVNVSVKNPIHDATVNVLGAVNLLELSVRHQVSQFIFASSGGAIYDEAFVPATEATALKPKSPYGISKLAVERYMEYYRDIRGLKTAILRYANVFGAGQTSKGENAVVPNFINRLRQGLPPIIYGAGNQTRDFVDVRDVASANVLVTSRMFSGVLNISSGYEISINQLLDIFASLLGRPIEPIFEPARQGEQARSCLTNIAARQVLGWMPQYNLRDTVAEILGVPIPTQTVTIDL